MKHLKLAQCTNEQLFKMQESFYEEGAEIHWYDPWLAKRCWQCIVAIGNELRRRGLDCLYDTQVVR